MPRGKSRGRGRGGKNASHIADLTDENEVVGGVTTLENTSETSSDSWKYRRRKIEDNTAKYNTELLDEGSNDDDNMKSNFNYLVENSTSDCNYFQFAAEKEWAKEVASADSGFFTLNLEILSNGLACIPFYERMGLDKSLIPEADIERCDKEAAENRVKYKEICDRLEHRDKGENEPIGEGKAIVNDSDGKNSETFTEDPSQSLVNSIAAVSLTQSPPTECKGPRKSPSDVTATKLEDEDLEEWLDTLLD